jgi:hypothetical protein
MSDSNLGSSGIFQADRLVIFMGFPVNFMGISWEVMGSLWEIHGKFPGDSKFQAFQGFSRRHFFELWPYDVPVCLKKLMAKLQVSQFHKVPRIPNKPRSNKHLPSGNLLHNYGKSSFFMGNVTINGDFP